MEKETVDEGHMDEPIDEFMLTFETYFLQQNSVYFLQVRMTYSQIISSFVTFTCLFSYFSGCFVSKFQSLFKGTYIRTWTFEKGHGT
jgi:hypothetical protein